MSSLPRSVFAAATTVAVLSLAACGGGGEDEPGEGSGEETSAAPSESPSEEEEPEPYLPVPEGVVLDPAGTDLALGESAVVAAEFRQGQSGALEVEVRSVEQVTFDDFSGLDLSDVDDALRPFFVETRVTNLDSSDLGGRTLPLYLIDDGGTLIEATSFAERFGPCASEALPAQFPTDESTRACFVFLAEVSGDEASVAFRPAEDVDLITWTGELTRPDEQRGGNRNGNRNGGKNNSGGGNNNGGGGGDNNG